MTRRRAERSAKWEGGSARLGGKEDEREAASMSEGEVRARGGERSVGSEGDEEEGEAEREVEGWSDECGGAERGRARPEC